MMKAMEKVILQPTFLDLAHTKETMKIMVKVKCAMFLSKA